MVAVVVAVYWAQAVEQVEKHTKHTKNTKNKKKEEEAGTKLPTVKS